MKFAITIKLEEIVDRIELRTTLKALVQQLTNPEIETLVFSFVAKEKKGKTKVSVIELPLNKITA